MITLPTRMLTQPSTSSRRCQDRTFSFRLSPFFSKKKPALLNMMPIMAMPSMPVAFTVSGFRSLGIAWNMITIEPPIRMEAEKSAENRESLWYPNVRLVSGDLRASRSKTHEASKAMLSPKSCNASERIAKLLVHKPPTSSKTVKATFKNAARRTRFSLSGINITRFST